MYYYRANIVRSGVIVTMPESDPATSLHTNTSARHLCNYGVSCTVCVRMAPLLYLIITNKGWKLLHGVRFTPLFGGRGVGVLGKYDVHHVFECIPALVNVTQCGWLGAPPCVACRRLLR